MVKVLVYGSFVWNFVRNFTWNFVCLYGYFTLLESCRPRCRTSWSYIVWNLNFASTYLYRLQNISKLFE